MSIFTNNLDSAGEEAAEYTQAVVAMLGERDPIMVLEAMPDEIEAAAAGLTDEELRRPEAPGKWSIIHVMRHMADSELVWANRLRFIVGHDKPEIIGYDQDAWSEKLHYEGAKLLDTLTLFSVLRASNLNLLHSLGADERARVGVHSERGEESIEHLIRLYAGHDIVHLAQIARIRKGLA
jgi:uncharacterized damage-inducible protein DinB